MSFSDVADVLREKLCASVTLITSDNFTNSLAREVYRISTVEQNFDKQSHKLSKQEHLFFIKLLNQRGPLLQKKSISLGSYVCIKFC